MRKILLLLLVISGLATGVSAQVYYQRDAGSLSVLAGSSVLPVTSIRPTLIVTDNDVPRLEENQYSEFQLAVDNALRYLNKSQIPTGILYDRVYPLARLDAFNDVSTDKSSYWHYIQAYAELYDAAYQPGSRPTVHQVKKRLGQQELADVVPIGVIRYRFNYISDLSKKNNQLTEDSDGYFRDVAGRTGSPYLTRQTLVVAALAPKVRAGNILFKLQSQFIFNNTGVAVSSVQVDPGEGKPVVTTTPDGNGFTVFYDTPGERTLRYVVTYANGTQATTYSAIEVEGYASGPASAAIEYRPCYEEPNGIFSSQLYQGPDEPAATAGKGDVLYYYASNKPCNGTKQPLTKPVIVLDGFDPGDERPGVSLYTYNLAYDTGQGKNLGEDLRKLGYDAVILNFPEYNVPNAATPTKRDGGGDYIQRNAMVLMELIEEVNRQLQQSGSTEKLTVVGPSMGGLIARYALAYMEQNNRPHN
ncbi:MAG: hypothetical protein ICV83_18825, partial [Cytophagales bacterium]|nr:hypothetical protein [Cytophagales bacterium]